MRFLISIRVILLFSAILFVGAFLRLHRLGVDSLSWNEVQTALVAEDGRVRGLWAMMTDPIRPLVAQPLRYLPLSLSMKLGGTSEFFLRLRDALFGIFSLLFIYLAASSLVKRRVALLALFLTSLSAYHIFFSRWNMAYGQLLFFSAAAFYLFKVAIDSGKLSHWLLFSAATLLAMSTHITALALLPSQFLFFALPWPHLSLAVKKKRLKQFVFSLLIIGFAYLPVFFLFIEGVESFWSEFTFVNRFKGGQWVSPISILHRLYEFSFGLTFSSAFASMPSAGAFLAKLLRVGLFASVIVLPLARSQLLRSSLVQKIEERWRYYCLLSLVFPIALGYLVFSRFGLFRPFYVIPAFPAFMILLALGIDSFRSKWVKALMAAFFVFGNFLSLSHHFAGPGYDREEWREAAQYVKRSWRSDDAFLFDKEFISSAFEYYFEGISPQCKLSIRIENSQKEEERIRRCLRGRARAWLLLSHTGETTREEYREIMDRMFAQLDQRDLKGIKILLYDTRRFKK